MGWCKVDENATLSATGYTHVKLSSALQRLSLLRLAVSLVWALALISLSLTEVKLPGGAWGILGAYATLTLAYWLPPHWQRRRNLLLLSVIIECQLLTLLLYFTGGATNPGISYFLVLLVVASVNLSRLQMLLIAALMVVDYSVLSFWYLPLQLESGHSHGLMSLHLAGMWLTFVISTAIVAILLPGLFRERQRRQREIQALREQQLKNEQLIGIATLAAGTAHEMGTPLMTLSMLLDDASARQLSADDLSTMQTQVERCRQSLKQLAMAGRFAQQHGAHDAVSWLERQLHRWRLSQPQALWQELEVDASAHVAASPLLDQALLNLLDNATEAGQQPIQIHCRVVDNQWELSVTQPDPKAAVHIREDEIFASEKELGLGIGMYLSNASVEQFGGSIHLQALPNGGSCCRLRLPILDTHHRGDRHP